jgi:hypothetical protein
MPAYAGMIGALFLKEFLDFVVMQLGGAAEDGGLGGQGNVGG